MYLEYTDVAVNTATNIRMISPFIVVSACGISKTYSSWLGESQRELSIVGKKDAQRAISETTQWFDPQGKN